MPRPESWMRIASSRPERNTCKLIDAPAGLNFDALFNRFCTT
jgi:hypothetical protein